jgi:GT2 family glycosyltransferase
MLNKHAPNIDLIWWKRGEDVQNFGDYLTIMLNEVFLGPAFVVGDAYRLIGSVIDDQIIHDDLTQLGKWANGTLVYWCCGARADAPLTAESLARIVICGVRGPLSRAALGLPESMPIGDPALLLPLLHAPDPDVDTRGKSICIPHIDEPKLDSWLLKHTGVDRIIRPSIAASREALTKFIDEIAASDFVLAGSLQAAIVACAYDRPFCFFDSGHLDVTFKWRDFAASIGIGAFFARNMVEGRRIYEDLIRPQLNKPLLFPILAVAPLQVRTDLLIEAARRDAQRLGTQSSLDRGALENFFGWVDQAASRATEGRRYAAEVSAHQATVSELQRVQLEVKGLSNRLSDEAARRLKEVSEAAGEVENLRREMKELSDRLLEEAAGRIHEVGKAKERAKMLLCERNVAQEERDILSAQLSQVARERANLAEEAAKAYRRPWRPIKYSINSVTLKALSAVVRPVAGRVATRFRKSADRRSPSRFDQYLAPPKPSGLIASPSAKEKDQAPGETQRITEVDVLAVSLRTSANPVVSIIIPCYGKPLLTLQCLRSIAVNPPKAAFEVLVVDDASGDPDVAFLEQVAGLRLEINPSNLGFLKSCNRAATLARGDYLFFLNDDTIVGKDWLDPLIEIFNRYPEAGLAGSKLLFPDGSLQEAGGIIWNTGEAWNYGRGDRPDRPQYNYVREADYISGCAILIRRNLWNELAGFDERYAPVYCEDSDLAFRIRAVGKKVYYCPFSVIVHLEGATNGTNVTTGAKAHQITNTETFRVRWRETLSRDHFAPGLEIGRARDRSRGRKIALVVDHYIPQPDQDAGSRTMMAIIESLLDAGYIVKFWPDNLNYDRDYATLLQWKGVEVQYGHLSFKAWIEENGDAISLALLSRPTVAPRYISLLRQETTAPIVYYGHDLHFKRMRMQGEKAGDPVLTAQANEMETIERAIWADVDTVLYPSAEETAVVEQTANRAATIIPYAYDDFGDDREPPKTSEIVFIAGFAHPPNIDAAVWLVNEILPLIRRNEPEAALLIVGANPTDAVRALASDGVKVTGRVSEEELREIYAHARVALVPLRVGAGVKSKVVEAMREGLPLVTTNVGAQGLPGVEGVAIVRDAAQEIADGVVRLMRDDALWLKISKKEVEYARQHFSREAFQAAILGAVHNAGSTSSLGRSSHFSMASLKSATDH